MAERDRIERIEYQLATVARQIAGMPVRIARTNTSQQRHVQLAMITEVAVSGTSPHYSSPYDLTFSIPKTVGHLVLVRAVLLDVGNEGTHGVLTVLGDTLDNLEFSAIDVRREGLPKVGDVVRVWTSDGSYAKAGDAPFVDGAYTSGRAIYCDALNPSDYLRGHSTWNESVYQVLVHAGGSTELEWVEVTDVVTEGGGGGGGGGDTVVPGYAIDTSGTGTVTVGFDPTEITGFATTSNTIQFFMHYDSAAAATDPKWLTVTAFDATKDQMWWHKSGSFKFQTTLTYATNKVQQLINDNDSWKWVDAHTIKSTINDSTAAFLHDAFKDAATTSTYVSGQDAVVKNETDGASGTDQTERLFVDVSAISGWSSGIVQLLGHDASGNLKWDSIANWLKLLAGFVSTDIQSIGHDNSADPVWQLDGSC